MSENANRGIKFYLTVLNQIPRDPAAFAIINWDVKEHQSSVIRSNLKRQTAVLTFDFSEVVILCSLGLKWVCVWTAYLSTCFFLYSFFNGWRNNWVLNVAVLLYCISFQLKRFKSSRSVLKFHLNYAGILNPLKMFDHPCGVRFNPHPVYSLCVNS